MIMAEFIIAILFLSALFYLAKIVFVSFANAKNAKSDSCCSAKPCLPKPLK